MRAINVFRPDAARAMSHAFDDVSASLHIPNTAIKAREMIAKRIIELGRQGEHEYEHLRDRVLNEANYRNDVQPSEGARNGRPRATTSSASRARSRTASV
jgi:hypothetical protein